MTSTNKPLNIHWPTDYEPKNRRVHVHNHIIINAPRSVVWQWLMRAENWPEWYSNAKDVKITKSSKPHQLADKSKFEWKTFGIHLNTVVDQYNHEKLIAWEAVGFLVHAYHAWGMEDTGNNQCLVITEERQYGLGAWLFHWVFPRRMWQKHHLWLTQLKKMAESSSSPSI